MDKEPSKLKIAVGSALAAGAIIVFGLPIAALWLVSFVCNLPNAAMDAWDRREKRLNSYWHPALILAALLLSGCSAVQTITPTRAHSRTSSFDSSTPAAFSDKTNSGVLGFERDALEQVYGAQVTANFLAYADQLVAEYGDQVSPPIKAVHGVSRGNGVFFVDAETFDHLRQMARWKKSNRERTGWAAKLAEKIL